jgi:hypothetical protein
MQKLIDWTSKTEPINRLKENNERRRTHVLGLKIEVKITLFIARQLVGHHFAIISTLPTKQNQIIN